MAKEKALPTYPSRKNPVCKQRQATNSPTVGSMILQYASHFVILICACQSSPPAPPEGAALPIPPCQNSSWISNTTFPSGLVSAAETLFRQGLADPRGCEYRSIEVRLAPFRSTHGWVLPPSEARPQRFAI